MSDLWENDQFNSSKLCCTMFIRVYIQIFPKSLNFELNQLACKTIYKSIEIFIAPGPVCMKTRQSWQNSLKTALLYINLSFFAHFLHIYIHQIRIFNASPTVPLALQLSTNWCCYFTNTKYKAYYKQIFQMTLILYIFITSGFAFLMRIQRFYIHRNWLKTDEAIP